MKSRRQARESQKSQLKERIGQSHREIEGLASQIKAKDLELKLVAEELKRVDEMYKRGLLPITRVIPLQREAARIEGERGALIAQSARAQGQISEIELQIISIDQNMRTDAMKELRDADARIAELLERKVAAEDQLKRIELRAPQSGIIHELNMHTVGGVINASEPVMQIVPNEDSLMIEAKFMPTDINYVSVGKRAILRFSSFNQRTTPEVEGIVTFRAADLTRDAQTGQSFYVGRIKLSEDAQRQMQDFKLEPGMPVEVFIQTGNRTPWSYITKPIEDFMARSMRET